MDAVDRPDDGPFSRHEGADSSQNHDQGGLAHVRRLAAHVGSRDHEHRRGLIKVHVVWHERAVEGLLDDEMAAADDLETALRDELWRHECQFACPLGEIGDDVDRGDGARGRLQRRKLCPGHGHQVVKEHLFPHEGAIPCSQCSVLECLELRCQETLGIFHGLAPHVVRRHGLGLASVELDIEAGNAVVGDLERVKAGAFALRTLHLGEKGFRVGAEQPQLVELGIVARADYATIAHVQRRRVGQRPRELGAQRAVFAKIGQQVYQEWRIGAGQGLPQCRQCAQRIHELDQVAWLRGAERDAGEDPFHVRHGAERLAHGLFGVEQRRHGRLPLAHGLVVLQGPREPAGELTGAHGCPGPIEHVDQRAFGPAGEACREFEVAARGRVDEERIFPSLEAERGQVGKCGALGLLHVLQESARRHDRQRVLPPVDAKACQIGNAELPCQQPLGGRELEMPRRARRDGNPCRCRRTLCREQLGGRQPLEFGGERGLVSQQGRGKAPAREIKPG